MNGTPVTQVRFTNLPTGMKPSSFTTRSHSNGAGSTSPSQLQSVTPSSAPPSPPLSPPPSPPPSPPLQQSQPELPVKPLLDSNLKSTAPIQHDPLSCKCHCSASANTAATVAAAAAATKAATAATAAAAAVYSLSDPDFHHGSQPSLTRSSRRLRFRRHPFTRRSASPSVEGPTSVARTSSRAPSTLRLSTHSRRHRRHLQKNHKSHPEISEHCADSDFKFAASTPNLHPYLHQTHHCHCHCHSYSQQFHQRCCNYFQNDRSFSTFHEHPTSYESGYLSTISLPVSSFEKMRFTDEVMFGEHCSPFRHQQASSPCVSLSCPRFEQAPQEQCAPQPPALHPSPVPVEKVVDDSLALKTPAKVDTSSCYGGANDVSESPSLPRMSVQLGSHTDQHRQVQSSSKTCDFNPPPKVMPPLTPHLERPPHVPRLDNLPSWNDTTARLQPSTAEFYGGYDMHLNDVRLTDFHSFSPSATTKPCTDFITRSDVLPLSENIEHENVPSIQYGHSLPLKISPLKGAAVTPPHSPAPHTSPCQEKSHLLYGDHSSSSESTFQSPTSPSQASPPLVDRSNFLCATEEGDEPTNSTTFSSSDNSYSSNSACFEQSQIGPKSLVNDPADGDSTSVPQKHVAEDDKSDVVEGDEENQQGEFRPATPLNYFIHNGLRYDGDVYQLRPPQERSIASRPERILEHKPAPLAHRQVFNRVYSEGTYNARPSSLRHTSVPQSPDVPDSESNGTKKEVCHENTNVISMCGAPAAESVTAPVNTHAIIDTPSQPRPSLPVTRPPSVRPTEDGMAEMRGKLARLVAECTAVSEDASMSERQGFAQREGSGGDALCDSENTSPSYGAVDVTSGDVLVDENGIPVNHAPPKQGNRDCGRKGSLYRGVRWKTGRNCGPSASGSLSISHSKPGHATGVKNMRKASLWKLLTR